MRLRAEAQRIRAAATRLRTINAGDFWISESADEFASRVGRAAPDLELAATRVETTATALQRYLQAMGDCQSRGRIAVARAREIDAEIARAQAGIQLENEQALKDIAATGIRAAQNPGVPAPPPASAWGPNWHSVVEGAQQERADVVRHFNAVVEDYEQAVRRCVSDLGPAVHDALTDPHHGLFDRIVHTAESAVAHVAENVGEWTAHHFLTLDGLSDSLGLAAAVAGFIPGGEGVALALSATKTAFDAGLVLLHEKKWKDVRDDAIGLGLFGAGRILTGVTRARTAAKAATESIDAATDVARIGADIQMAEHAEQAVDSSLITQLKTAQAERQRFDGIVQGLGQDTSKSWWRESSRAFRYLDLKVPSEDALKIDRWARYSAKGSEVIGHYSQSKDTAELVKSAAEAVTGEKPEGQMIGDYEFL